jgi:ABC-type multidrug transport system fused ATPase/permease subunit
MVAHRLSTVANMDRIVFVRPLAICDDGRTQVTIHSSLSELYAAEALFREMSDAQGFRPQ